MRQSRLAALLLLPALVFGLVAPSAATEVERTRFHRAERTSFSGQYFPAGMPDTGTVCPYGNFVPPAFCIVDGGSSTELPNGRLRIRDMIVFELAFAYSEGLVEPRKTGYDIVVVNANLDSSFSGPMWGTWKLYSFGDVLMFTGGFVGRFKDGIPAVHFFGKGTGIYEGQRMRGSVAREMNADGYNMFGRIVEPRSRHR